jgi:hypothetical protein
MDWKFFISSKEDRFRRDCFNRPNYGWRGGEGFGDGSQAGEVYGDGCGGNAIDADVSELPNVKGDGSGDGQYDGLNYGSGNGGSWIRW